MGKRYRTTFRFEGKRYYASGSTKEEATVNARIRQHEMEEGKRIRETSLTVEEWALEAVELYKKNQSEETRERYNGVLKSSVLRPLGHRQLRKVTPAECQACLNLQEGRSRDHIERVRRMICFVFDTAVDNNLIRESPAKNLVSPIGTVHHNRSITKEEREALLAACQDDRFLLFLFMLECGCRPIEARRIRREDFMTVDGVHLLHIRGTKTEKADRYVPVPEVLWERVKDHAFEELNKAQYNRRVLKLKDAMRDQLGGEYISVEVGVYNGKHHYKKEWLQDPLEEDFRPYFLRHTYCTDLRDRGVDLRDAQYLMGHADIRMTANIYTHSDISTALRVAGWQPEWQPG